MHKVVGLVIVVLLLGFTTFVLAKSENSNNDKGNGQSNGNNQSQNSNQGQGSQNSNSDNSNRSENSGKKEQNNLLTSAEDASGSASPTPDPKKNCDPNANWKNHGEYVSCVARLHPGGQAVSEAARSSIGKKNATPSGSLTPSPIASSSASPTATASASASPEATSSAITQVLEPVRNGAKNVANSLKYLVEQFQALFSL